MQPGRRPRTCSRRSSGRSSVAVSLDDVAAKVEAGERLSDQDVDALETGKDIIALGMLAESVRRKLHGTTVTYVRVADVDVAAVADAEIPAGAGEVRIFK